MHEKIKRFLRNKIRRDMQTISSAKHHHITPTQRAISNLKLMIFVCLHKEAKLNSFFSPSLPFCLQEKKTLILSLALLYFARPQTMANDIIHSTCCSHTTPRTNQLYTYNFFHSRFYSFNSFFTNSVSLAHQMQAS